MTTKGHALEDHAFLRRFPELRQEAIGNDQADKAAKKTRTTCFNPNVVRLSNALVDRTKKYTVFITHVHAIIARVHAASQELRKSPAFSMDPDRRTTSVGDKVLHTSPTIPPDLHHVPIRPKASKKLGDENLAKAGPLMIGGPKFRSLFVKNLRDDLEDFSAKLNKSEGTYVFLYPF